MSSDPVDEQNALTNLTRSLVDVEAAWKARLPYIEPGEEQRRYDTVFRTTWATFRQQTKDLLALVQDDHQTDAPASFHNESRHIYKVLQDFMAWDQEYNQGNGLAAGAASRAVYTSTWWLLIGGAPVAVGLAAAIALGLIRHISNPLSAMTAAMRRLADRDMTVTVPSLGRGDEIGSMAGAVQVFKDNMVEADRLMSEQEADRLKRLKRSTRIDTLVSAFERQVGSTVSVLTSASTQMEATASSMTGKAAQTDRQATAVTQAAHDSSHGVQTVAAASEQLASSITEINRQVASSSTITGKAVGSVRRTDGTVQALAESAARIGDVVNLITSIANQTNLLALNATIEAARAGEAGKGFAVVASEVKSLAQQTARATNEIAAQIAQVQQATNDAVDAIREIGGLIEEVGAITTSIAAAVEQQGAATAEIARNVQQTAVSTQTVTANIAGVSRAANDTGTAAGQVLSAAGDLSRQAERLSAEVGSFITEVRSA
jgi:methyl-accepting chemotaxis protein